MLGGGLNTIKLATNRSDLFLKVAIACSQRKYLSSKPPQQSFQKTEGNERKKKQPIPKITLIAQGNDVSVTTLEEAQKLSKRRDLKLVRLVDMDTKTQRPVYKLMTGSEYHAEDLKQREERKKEKATSNELKGEKVLILSSVISEHDLKTQCNKILKWIAKKYEVRVVINGMASNMEKAENVYKLLEDQMQSESRFVQKRTKGNDIKFQVIPPKTNTENTEHL